MVRRGTAGIILDVQWMLRAGEEGEYECRRGEMVAEGTNGTVWLSIAQWRCLGCLVSLQRSLRARASASAIYGWVSSRPASFGMSTIKLSCIAPALSLCLLAYTC